MLSNLSKKQWIIGILVTLAVIAAIVVALLVRPGAKDEGAAPNSNDSTPTATSPSKNSEQSTVNPTATPTTTPTATGSEAWPTEWPSLPATPSTSESGAEDHAPGENDVGIDVQPTDPVDALPSDYIDDLPVDDHGETVPVAPEKATFPDYQKDLAPFASAYADPTLSSKKWMESISKYTTKSLASSFDGFDPKNLPWSKGKVEISGPDTLTYGRVNFIIKVDGKDVAKCFAQYQDIWRVYQITTP